MSDFKFKEVPHLLPEDMGRRASAAISPCCNAGMWHGSIRCPDGKPGCLVKGIIYLTPRVT
jgi:hypothetical protein